MCVCVCMPQCHIIHPCSDIQNRKKYYNYIITLPIQLQAVVAKTTLDPRALLLITNLIISKTLIAYSHVIFTLNQTLKTAQYHAQLTTPKPNSTITVPCAITRFRGAKRVLSISMVPHVLLSAVLKLRFPS